MSFLDNAARGLEHHKLIGRNSPLRHHFAQSIRGVDEHDFVKTGFRI